MKIHPLFKWFGSKWSHAKHYPEPLHDLIIEPFAGSAGYSLNYCDKQVVIWDEDNNVKMLWEWLIKEATSELILDIPVGLPAGTDIRTLSLSIGQMLLLKHWQRTNNAGECWKTSKWSSLPGQWTHNTRQRVSYEVYAIKHWKFADPWKYLDVPATWFMDPPYIYNYRYSPLLNPFPYDKMDSLVQTIHKDSLIIACEATDSRDGRIPTYLPFTQTHSTATMRRKTKRSNECTYIRAPRNSLLASILK